MTGADAAGFLGETEALSARDGVVFAARICAKERLYRSLNKR